MVEQPATHLLVLALVAVTCLLRQRCLGHAAVGLSYRAAVERGEWWRCVTCLFSHVDLLHLLNNTYSLLGNGGFIEEAYGTLAFLHTTALLCLVSIPVSPLLESPMRPPAWPCRSGCHSAVGAAEPAPVLWERSQHSHKRPAYAPPLLARWSWPSVTCWARATRPPLSSASAACCLGSTRCSGTEVGAAEAALRAQCRQWD